MNGEQTTRVPDGPLPSYRSFRSSLRKRRRTTLTAVWTAAATLDAVYLAYLVVGALHGTLPDVVQWTFSLGVDEVMVLLCALLCLYRARFASGERLGWGLIGGGIAVYTGGDSYWVFTGLSHDTSPALVSWADLGYTLGMVMIIAGIILIARRSVARFTPGQWLDAASAATAVLSAVCAALLSPLVAASGGGTEAIAVNLLYPGLDAIVLAITLGAIALSGWRPNVQWWLLAAGATALVIGDSAYALAAQGFTSGGLIDTTWALAFGLFGTAAVAGRSELRQVRTDARRLMLMPAAVILVAVATLAYMALEPGSHPLDVIAVALAIGSIVLGLARFGYLFHENALLVSDADRSLRDPLTGLPSRESVFERLDRELAVAGERAERAAAIVIDVNRFKDITEGLGHAAGDRVLSVIGARLARSLPARCTATRLAGEEFLAVVPRVSDLKEAERLAYRLAGAMRESCEIDGVLVHTELSVGVAISPDHGASAQRLVSHAWAAMRTAKTAGDSVGVYAPNDEDATLERVTLTGELLDGIGSGDIFLLYQPKLELHTGRLAGVEALVRWHHPSRGLLAPGAFIPAAEQSPALMRSLTLHVLGLALTQCRQWLGSGCEIPVAVNLSARHLLDPDLPDDVRRALDQHGVPARLLELEVTETAVMSDEARSTRTLTQLREFGVRLAIDDFGTGQSSLRRLRELPVHVLKIDRSFVSAAGRGPGDLAIVETIVGLAHAVGAEAVAEGIEDERTLELLAACGCDIGQGFHLGRPVDASQIRCGTARRAQTVPASVVVGAP